MASKGQLHRHRDGRKLWELTPTDLKSYSRWYDDSRARDPVFAAADTGFAPWVVAPSNQKKNARILRKQAGRTPMAEQ